MLCLNEWHGDNATMYHGDCVEILRQLPENSVDLGLYSPPFASLYVYSEAVRDMGNVASDEEFAESYAHVARELFRVIRPGRICVVHCAELPMFKYKDGAMGFKDFPGMLVRIHEAAGWIMHSPRVTIWKDPVTEMQRTKSHGLLYKTLRSDSAGSRVGNPDFLLVFRKPGDNAVAIQHPDYVPLTTWQEWASPVWLTIDQSETLNVQGARDDKDGRHICPLQLDVIERVVRLWSNPGDIVLSPFAGIGSEGVGALTFGRRYVGIELKDSYFTKAIENLRAVDRPAQLSMFGAAK